MFRLETNGIKGVRYRHWVSCSGIGRFIVQKYTYNIYNIYNGRYKCPELQEFFALPQLPQLAAATHD